MPRLPILLAALVLAVGPGACVTPQSVEPPRVALENVRLLEARGLSQRIQVDLLVVNPNDFEIPLSGLNFAITVNGADFAQGLSNEAVTLPRRGRAKVPVDVMIPMLAVLRQLQAVQRQGALDYRLSGTAFLDHVLLPRIDFDRTGRLDLRYDSDGRRLQVVEG